MNAKDPHRYDDMLELPHHVSPRRHPMSMTERAAQFSPFAALSGYDAAIQETARLTEDEIQLSEDDRQALDASLQELLSRIKERPAASITWFIPDERKKGGAYTTVTVHLRKVDPIGKILYTAEGHTIPLARIISIQPE
ncbi:MAG: hypothetical protein IKG46_13885 [Solobacterium sp.]|nr:hypothetical protein [Solobacterium sp.]